MSLSQQACTENIKFATGMGMGLAVFYNNSPLEWKI